MGLVHKPVDDHLTGSTLEGRYTVGPRLARGGTGGVYRCVDQRLDRTVAVKILHAHLTEDPSFIDRFAREARAAARLSHPNVVSVLDQGRTDDGHVFLVMEYVEGGTLRDVLRRKRFLRPGEALTILSAVAAGLAAAHQAGLIHRDIKPENVLMRPDGTVKVADFGLSRAADQHTTSGAVLGTVAYASPELVTERTLDARSDLYSLGIMAWEMLTGRRPFDGSPWTIAHAHAEKTVPSLLEAVPGIDRGLAEAVGAWTARDPQARPADGAELLGTIGELRRQLSLDALDHVPEGWEQGPGPAAPRPEDPGATTLPSTAPATGPIDLKAVDALRQGGSTAAPAAGLQHGSAAGADDSAAQDAPADDDDVPPITQVLSIPLGAEGGRAPEAPGDGEEAPTEAMPGLSSRSQGVGSSASAATEAMPGFGGQSPDAAPTEAMPRFTGEPRTGAPTEHGSAPTEAMPAWQDAPEDRDGVQRTSVLPSMRGGAAAAGAAGVAGAASAATRTGSTAVGASGGLGASVDPSQRRRGPSVDRLAAFDEPSSSDGDTAEQETEQRPGRLRESAPVDPSKPTVRLQQGHPLKVIVALALAALLVAAAAFLGWLLGSGSFRTAVVPEVAGTTQSVAETSVETEGFSNVSVREQPSTEVPAGSVIESSPAAGTQARVGEQIVLTVSSGPEQVEVPAIVGMSQTDAESQLSSAGLEVGSVSEQFDDSEEGSVVSASPSAGARVEEGSTVDLVVSAGAEPQEVPRVVGSDADDARDQLEDLGFTVEIEEVAGGNLNRVVSQSQDGTTITLRVI